MVDPPERILSGAPERGTHAGPAGGRVYGHPTPEPIGGVGHGNQPGRCVLPHPGACQFFCVCGLE